MSDTIHWINALVMAELLLGSHLFAFYLPHKEKYWLRTVCGAGVCVIVAFLIPSSVPFLDPYGLYYYLAIFLLAFLALRACYEETLWAVLFCCVSGYAMQHLASRLYDCCKTGFALLGISLEQPPVLGAAVNRLLFVATYIVCYFLFARIVKRYGHIRIDNKFLLLLSGTVLLIAIVMGIAAMWIGWTMYNEAYAFLIAVYGSLSCVFALSIQFAMLSNKELQYEITLLNQLLEERKRQYELSKITIEQINLKCHDLRHQIRTLRHQEGMVDKNALRQIEKAVDIYDSVVKTGNDALDIILTEKSLLCEKEHIQFTCIADGDKLSFMETSDLYALFGNALENAITSVMALEDPERRNINLDIRVIGGMLSIHIENYFSGALEFQDGLPQTKSQDRMYHGYGMKSMRLLAEKYGGELSAQARQNVFYLDILIPLANTK